MQLTREVRFCLVPDGGGAAEWNSWAGVPASDAVAPQVALRVTLGGTPDARTGYLCDISLIDRRIRERIDWLRALSRGGLPGGGARMSESAASERASAQRGAERASAQRGAERASAQGGAERSGRPRDSAHAESSGTCGLAPSPGGRLLSAAAILPALWADLDAQDWSAAQLQRLELALSGALCFTARREGLPMVEVVQQFEFSAAHRLYCPDLGDEENRRVFGKCANPNGHGHNYLLEVTVSGRPDESTGRVIALDAFQRVVRAEVIDRFDHKHLNLDCEEFAGVNPSVENIAQVIWSRLEGRFAPAALSRVRVWETPKTCAEVSAEDAGADSRG